jgi:hypothetical protein
MSRAGRHDHGQRGPSGAPAAAPPAAPSRPLPSASLHPLARPRPRPQTTSAPQPPLKSPISHPSSRPPLGLPSKVPSATPQVGLPSASPQKSHPPSHAGSLVRSIGGSAGAALLEERQRHRSKPPGATPTEHPPCVKMDAPGWARQLPIARAGAGAQSRLNPPMCQKSQEQATPSGAVVQDARPMAVELWFMVNGGDASKPMGRAEVIFYMTAMELHI